MWYYEQQLKSKRWQQKRLKVFERDGFKCKNTSCKNPDKVDTELHVHHLDYIPGTKAFDYPDDMLITLCNECHAKENDRNPVERYLYRALLHKGFLSGDLLAFTQILWHSPVFTKTLLNKLRAYQNGQKIP